MDRLEVATAFAMQLYENKPRIEKHIFRGDPSYGVNSKEMLQVRVHLFIPPPHAPNLFKTIESLFPHKEGDNFRFYSLFASGEVEVSVYFPVPYKSADRFPEAERGSFCSRMAFYTISNILLNSRTGTSCESLLKSIPDPRHPDEISWIRKKAAIKYFVKSLVPIRKAKPKRNFKDYLK